MNQKGYGTLNFDNFENILQLQEITKKNVLPEFYEKIDVYIKKLIKHTGNEKKIKIYIRKLQKIPKIQTGSAPQFHGKKSKVMVKVPISVKNYMNGEAKKLKDSGFRGGIATGHKRAKQLTSKPEISIEDVRFIRNWFSRHIYISYPSYLKWKKSGKPYNDNYWKRIRGIYAIAIWGGEPAFRWINSSKIINLLNKHYNKNYKKIKIPK